MAEQNKVKAWLSQLNDSKEKFGSKEWFKAYGLVVLGTLIFVIADTMFNNPYHLAPGGTYGLKNVLNTLFPWELSYYLICLDLPLMIIGLIILGPRFGIKTLLSVVLGYLFVWLIENTWGYAPIIHVGDWANAPIAGGIEVAKSPRWDWVTFLPDHMGQYFVPDYVLNTIVSGLLYGVGIGLIFKAGATSGGSDIISMIINKYTHLSLGTLVIIIDSCIALTSLFIGGDIRLPLYSVLLIYIEGKVIDMIVPPTPKKKKEISQAV